MFGGIVEFARYYVNFLREFFQDLWEIITTLFNVVLDILYRKAFTYFKELANTSHNFGVFDWICYVIVFIINVSFIVFIILRLAQIIRKNYRRKHKYKEKEELIEEIEGLNYKIEELINEKNALFALKVTGIGAGGKSQIEAPDDEDEEDAKAKKTDSRFVKLIDVDLKYEDVVTTVNSMESDLMSLPELVDRFVNYSASQLHLYYDKKVIAIYFSGMATSKIMILEGISGTGKTSLPYAMGKFFGNDAAIVSVQPSWRDRAEILGYLNEFTKRFNETDFLKALYETTYREDVSFIILDEMNLARIEYYFAEFLSIMEMPDINEWKIDIVPNALPSDPKNMINGKILVPQNVWFVGTANKDDSTFTITDKVYDRATVIVMNTKAKYIDAPLTQGVSISFDYLDSLFLKAQSEYAMSTKTLANLAKVDQYIQTAFKITFGNRIMKQMKLFVPTMVACGFSENEAIDYFLAHKILRKFESLNLSFLHDEMNGLIAFFDKMYGKGQFSECIEYLKDLIKQS